MQQLMTATLSILAGAYLLGCIVGAYYIVRLHTGADIRAVGSGNAGARNVARVVGWPDAVAVLLFGAAKGATAVWLAHRLVAREWSGGLALSATIAGHIWPIQLGRRGGKGAATMLGGLAVIDPLATGALLGLGATLTLVTDRFTVSGLVAIALAAPALVLFRHSWPSVVPIGLASAIVLVAHHPIIDASRSPHREEKRP